MWSSNDKDTAVNIQLNKMTDASGDHIFFTITCGVTRVIWFRVSNEFLGQWSNPKTLWPRDFYAIG